MPHENFRRELNQVFDDVAGSPSAALPDRVRSSLKEVPEQRGPFWIAGVAAALIAVIVVGVLVVANFNRHPTGVVPAGQQSPSPSASPTPDSNLQPFVCVSTGLGTAPAPPVVFVSDVRTGTHAGYDRLTIEFTNGRPGTVELRTQTGTTFTQGASGQTITLEHGQLPTISDDLTITGPGSTLMTIDGFAD